MTRSLNAAEVNNPSQHNLCCDKCCMCPSLMLARFEVISGALGKMNACLNKASMFTSIVPINTPTRVVLLCRSCATTNTETCWRQWRP